jgi:2-amino-4-hydroxy-6-hydroxymethyldihydropteridine diphosphokinase
MALCLLALGSNLGDRERNVRAALHDLDSLSGTRLIRNSRCYPFASVGGAAQPEFLNAAALIETSGEPAELMGRLLEIEARHGRRRAERWAARTLDLDLLLFDDRVIDSPTLTVPHPRFSYRRFVLTPACEIAAAMVHPSIGWSIGQLAAHLDAAGDWVAIVSPDETERRRRSATLVKRYGARIGEPPPLPRPVDEAVTRQRQCLWPRRWTTWLALDEMRRIAGGGQRLSFNTLDPSTGLPKLTILLDPAPTGLAAGRADWPILAGEKGRGPTLRVSAAGDDEELDREIHAAIESVWPDLGRFHAKRLQ